MMFPFPTDEQKASFKSADSAFGPELMVCIGGSASPDDPHGLSCDLPQNVLEGKKSQFSHYTVYTSEEGSDTPAAFLPSPAVEEQLSRLIDYAGKYHTSISFCTNCAQKWHETDEDRFSENYGVASVVQEVDCENCGWRLMIRNFVYGGSAVLYKEGVTLSVVAQDTDSGTILDLRNFVSDQELKWDAPDGNWQIWQFYCERTPDVPVNTLSFAESLSYLEEKYAPLTRHFFDVLKDSGSTFYFSNLQFTGKNRNIWEPSFNETFEKKFGFDPAPYYLSLFMDTDENSPVIRAQFIEIRSDLLRDGFLAAAAAFCHQWGVEVAVSHCEARMAESVWISGDPIAARSSVVPVAQMNWSYLYGLNSVKVAAAAALYADGPLKVGCEMFTGSQSVSPESVYRDSMLAFANGADRLCINMNALKNKMTLSQCGDAFDEERYLNIITRIQSVLGQGISVSDIAVLYPFDSIASQTCLYDKLDEQGFEYPANLQNVDYLTLLNNLISYCGHDADLLHPSLIESRCHIEGNRLKLTGNEGDRLYSLLILPSSKMISLETLRFMRDFYDAGGKILATGILPRRASGFAPGEKRDEEVHALLLHIFGEECFSERILRDVYRNENDAGGMAAFLPSDSTSLDGTYVVSGRLLDREIRNMRISHDMIVEGRPRVPVTGVLDIPLEEYRETNFTPDFGIGGMFAARHIHSAYADIYYLANATNRPYNGRVLLRGEHILEFWDAETGRIHRLNTENEKRDGTYYTAAQLEIDADSCVILVART